MNLQHLILLESKEVLREWGSIRLIREQALRVSTDIRAFYKITCLYKKKTKGKGERKAEKQR